LAVGEAGDAVQVLVEDVNGQTFGGRCAATPGVTTTLQNFSIPLDGTNFACGPQGLDKSLIHRVTVLPSDTQGNGITITVGSVAFASTPSSVNNWTMFEAGMGSK